VADDFVNNLQAQHRKHAQELEELSERVEALRNKYDRFFMGLDRIPPERERADLDRALRFAEVRRSHRTELKFRLASLRNRFTTNARRWDRIMRMIEEGKFRRERGALQNMGSAQRPNASDTPTNSGGAVNELYDSWVAARRELGKSTDVKFDQFAKRIEEQKARQQKKYGWKEVDYTVRIKNGKVSMVARRGGQKTSD
jgi:hypothetical protein